MIHYYIKIKKNIDFTVVVQKSSIHTFFFFFFSSLELSVVFILIRNNMTKIKIH